MRGKVSIMMAVTLLLAAEKPKDDPTKKDLAKLQGDWVVVSIIRNGKKAADDEVNALSRTVKAEKFTIYNEGQILTKGILKLDATKKPKTIDALPDYVADKSKPMLGIYEFDGDKYKVCFAPSGEPRPTKFASEEGSKHVLTVWQRPKKQPK